MRLAAALSILPPLADLLASLLAAYTADRAGYAYAMYMVFELYYPTFAQGASPLTLRALWTVSSPRSDPLAAVASFSPNAMAASVLFSTFFSFVIIFNGVVQVRPAALRKSVGARF